MDKSGSVERLYGGSLSYKLDSSDIFVEFLVILIPAIKRLGPVHETDQSCLSSARLKDMWSYLPSWPLQGQLYLYRLYNMHFTLLIKTE